MPRRFGKASYAGFTIYELLFVITVLAILGIIGHTIYQTVYSKTRNSRRIADIKAIGLAYENSFNQNSGYTPISPSNFADNVIPVPPEGGAYNFVYGPDSVNACFGTKVCTTLEPAVGSCIQTSSTCYCYVGNNTNLSECEPLSSTASCPPGWDELGRTSGTVVNSSFAGSYPTRITKFISPPAGYNLSNVLFKGIKGEGHPDLGCLPGAPNDDLDANPQCDNLQMNEGFVIRLNSTQIYHNPDLTLSDPSYDDSYSAFSLNTSLNLSPPNRIEIDHDNSTPGPGSVYVDLAVCAQKS